MLFGRGLAKFDDLRVVHVGDQILRFFAELIDLLRLAQVLKEGFLVRVALELLEQLFDFVSTMCTLQFDCEKVYARNSVVNGVVSGFPGTLRWVGHKLLLRLILVGLVDRCANSALSTTRNLGVKHIW